MSDQDSSVIDPREQRALQIAACFRIVRDGPEWIVPSQTGHGKYRVNVERQTCNCPDHESGHTRCKHIIAAEIVLRREVSPDGTVTETKTVRLTYGQDWHNYNLAQTNEKAQFVVLLRDLCATVEQPEQTIGRPRLPLADMAFATTFKVYSGFSSRRFTTDLREAAYRGLIDNAPHFNSVSNYLADPTLRRFCGHSLSGAPRRYRASRLTSRLIQQGSAPQRTAVGSITSGARNGVARHGLSAT